MGALAKFGAALRSIRGNRSLETVAGAARVTISNLSKYELEQKWPSREVLERILDGLGISFVELAQETERQARLAAGEVIPFPAPQPSPDELERRMREIAREETRAALGIIAVTPGLDLQKFADFIRSEGVEPNLESVDVLRSLLRQDREGGSEG